MIGRSQVRLAATACVLVYGACSAPEASTDLRTGGPPQVLTVLIADDPDNAGVVETATFCKANDTKRPGLVPANPDGPDQVCPDDLAKGVDEVTDTNPINWYVRIQFDELLNTKVEDLVPILDNGQPSGLFMGTLKNTLPVTVTCNGNDVPYDMNSYYDPSGNAFSWPVGPSLFIQANDSSTIATGSDCTVQLKPDGVESKGGTKVPTGQLGPYMFKIAPLALVGVTPPLPKDLTKPPTQSPMAPALVTLNAAVVDASLAAADVQIVTATNCMGDGKDLATAHPAKIVADKDGQSLDISDTGVGVPMGDAFLPSKTYIITFTANAPIHDAAGGPGTLVDGDGNSPSLCFTTSSGN